LEGISVTRFGGGRDVCDESIHLYLLCYTISAPCHPLFRLIRYPCSLRVRTAYMPRSLENFTSFFRSYKRCHEVSRLSFIVYPQPGVRITDWADQHCQPRECFIVDRDVLPLRTTNGERAFVKPCLPMVPFGLDHQAPLSVPAGNTTLRLRQGSYCCCLIFH